MLEIVGELWEQKADALVVTTNGIRKSNGHAVMGRGCAREAAERFPDLPRLLGEELKLSGNHVYWFEQYRLFTFPTKHDWVDPSDLNLIRQSAEELAWLVQDRQLHRVVLPRPGVGAGRLSWDNVRKVLEPWFDDRFVVISR